MTLGQLALAHPARTVRLLCRSEDGKTGRLELPAAKAAAPCGSQRYFPPSGETAAGPRLGRSLVVRLRGRADRRLGSRVKKKPPAPPLDIQLVPVDQLKPAPYNPRRIDLAAMTALEKSLERFGYVEPIVWNRRSSFVVGGHQRLKALRRRGVREVYVVAVDLDDTQERQLNLTLNNPAVAAAFAGGF